MAMEDFRVDVVIGKGPGATAIPLEIPPFTLVGATTRAGPAARPAARPVRLHRPPGVLRARSDLDRIVRRSAGLLDVELRGDGVRRDRAAAPGAPRGSPTGCCAGSATTPRCAADGVVDPRPRPRRRWSSSRSTSPGLDRLDRAVLDVLCRRFGGGPVGVSTLAVAVGEERETVEEVAEPFLVRQGLLARTPRGRVATPAGVAAPRADARRRGRDPGRPPCSRSESD